MYVNSPPRHPFLSASLTNHREQTTFHDARTDCVKCASATISHAHDPPHLELPPAKMQSPALDRSSTPCLTSVFTLLIYPFASRSIFFTAVDISTSMRAKALTCDVDVQVIQLCTTPKASTVCVLGTQPPPSSRPKHSELDNGRRSKSFTFL